MDTINSTRPPLWKRGGVHLFVLFMMMSQSAWAQTLVAPSVSNTPEAQTVAKPLLLITTLLAISLTPFLVMMTTSFVKITVVLGLVRNAMGTQQVPPNPVITGLAMILTLYIMTPVGMEIYRSAGNTINQGSKEPLMSQVTVNLMVQAAREAAEPMRNFLYKHAHEKERILFFSLAQRMRDPQDRDSVTEKGFDILIPSFVISELSEAFQIGFIIFLPFLVLDVVVTNILLSLGMFQLSPVTVSLPFKLLLFVLVDGWHLIAKGLVMGYV